MFKLAVTRLYVEARAAATALSWGTPDIILPTLYGIGDQLMLTTVARELRRRNPRLKIWQPTRHPDILRGNPDFCAVWKNPGDRGRYPWIWRKKVLPLSYSGFLEHGREESPHENIIVHMCRLAGLTGEIEIRPWVHLSTEEIRCGRLAPRQVVVQCSGLQSFKGIDRNKLWPPERFEAVVQELKRWSAAMGEPLTFIQVGLATDPPISGCVDLRGKQTLREAAAVLHEADAFLGLVNGLMHLARAADCRSVILYGGREHARQSGYMCNENIESHIECAPCWQHGQCDRGNACMMEIEPPPVIAALRRVLEKRAAPLETDTANLDTPPAQLPPCERSGPLR
jgi:hypothetical protein